MLEDLSQAVVHDSALIKSFSLLSVVPNSTTALDRDTVQLITWLATPFRA